MKKRLSVFALGLIACSGEDLDVGNNAAGGGSGSTAYDPELADWSSLKSCSATGESNAAYVGVWDGGIEDFLLNPLTRVRLEITAASLDGVCGTLTWGFGTDPPLPLTDPNESGLAYVAEYSGNKLVEGVSYTILEGAARDDTLRLRVSYTEAWQDFCEAQERTYNYGGGWWCIEPYSNMAVNEGSPTCSIETSHGTVTHPIKVCNACSFLTCTCNSAGCTASPYHGTSFDFSLEGTDGDVLTMPWLNPEQAIRLTRTE